MAGCAAEMEPGEEASWYAASENSAAGDGASGQSLAGAFQPADGLAMTRYYSAGAGQDVQDGENASPVAAQPGISKAIEKSQHGRNTALDRLDQRRFPTGLDRDPMGSLGAPARRP